MRVEDVGRGFNNGGGIGVGENLVDVIGFGVGNDCYEVKNDILGVYILSELERDLVFVIRRNWGFDFDSG